MPLTRTQFAQWLGRQFSPIMAKLNPAITATDDAVGLGDAIDGTLLELGVPYDDLVGYELDGTVAVLDAQAVGRYKALELFHSRLLHKTTFNMGRGSLTEEEGKLLAQIERSMLMEAEKAAARGYPVGPAASDTSVGIGHLSFGAFSEDTTDEWGSS